MTPLLAVAAAYAVPRGPMGTVLGAVVAQALAMEIRLETM